MAKLLPVLICGGVGTRLWPESRESMPKQFVALTGNQTLFQETVRRVTGPLFDAPIVLTNYNYRFFVSEQLREIGASATVVTEPVGRDTGAAIAVAATLAAQRGPGTIVVTLVVDVLMTKLDEFWKVCTDVAQLAKRGYIVTLGIKPTEPQTGYGYILPGDELGKGVYGVEAYVEKPDRKTAEHYIENGYLWNSGNLFFRADTMLGELQAFEPEMALAAAATVASAKVEGNFLVLGVSELGALAKKSIDRAVMERTSRAAVAPADIGWLDVGNWDALWRLSRRDADGNSFHGEGGVALGSNDVHVRSASKLTAVVGVNDVIVVTTQDAVLVVGREHGDKVKEVVEALKAKRLPEATDHKSAFRTWGYCQTINHGARYQVKRVVVSPGQGLSLQKHRNRGEHWIVVSGAAEVTCGEEVKILHENESIYLPIGSVRRIFNAGNMKLELIEVQTGSDLGEGGISRSGGVL